jgi:hypothetical protein
MTSEELSNLPDQILKLLDGIDINDAQTVLGRVLIHLCLEDGYPKLFAMVSFAAQWEDMEKKYNSTPSKTHH